MATRRSCTGEPRRAPLWAAPQAMLLLLLLLACIASARTRLLHASSSPARPQDRGFAVLQASTPHGTGQQHPQPPRTKRSAPPATPQESMKVYGQVSTSSSSLQCHPSPSCQNPQVCRHHLDLGKGGYLISSVCFASSPLPPPCKECFYMAMLRSLSFVTFWFALLFNLLPTPFAKTGFAVAKLRSLDCFATSPSLYKDTFCCDHVQVLGLLYNISPVCKDRFCSGPCFCFATFSPPPFYKDRFCCGHAAPHNLSGHEYTGCNRASLGLGVGWGISCSGPCNISPYPFAKTAFVVAMLRSLVFLCNIPQALQR